MARKRTLKRNFDIQQEYQAEKSKKKKHIELIFTELSDKYYLSEDTIKKIVYGEQIIQ